MPDPARRPRNDAVSARSGQRTSLNVRRLAAPALLWGVILVGTARLGPLWRTSPPAPAWPVAHAANAAAQDPDGVVLRRGAFVRTVRLNGLVEAVDFHSVVAPRLTGGGNPALTIVRMAPKGVSVRKGDLLVEFDRQAQVRQALDKRAEWMDLEEQIRRKRAEQAAAQARDDTELKLAESAVALGELEMVKNPLLPPIEAEKNTLTLEAAQARLALLRKTFALKRRAAAADLAILEVRRDRAASAMRHAEQNAERMIVRAPIDGLVVLKSIWKGGQMGEPQDGEEVWGGTALLDVVGPSAMRVRVKASQADMGDLRPGLPARVTLDAYPDRSYPARLDQVSPIGTASQFSPRVRTFVALFSVQGVDAQLTPDLSAAVDVELERVEDALVAPRSALVTKHGQAFLRVRRGSSEELRDVTLGPANDTEVVILSGADAGLVVPR